MSNWPQPFLVAVVGLPLALLLFDLPGHGLRSVLLSGLLAIAGWRLARWGRGKPRSFLALSPARADRATVQQTLAVTTTLLRQLQVELPQAHPVAWHNQAAEIATGLNRQEIHLTVLGGKGVGKSSLVEYLQTHAPLARPCLLAETELFNPGVVEDLRADLVLLVVAGDLTEREYQALTRLHKHHQRTLLVWNKQDQFLPVDRPLVLQRLCQRLQGVLAPEDVLAIAVQPSQLRVRQVLADGSSQERLEQPPPDVAALLERLLTVLTQEAADLVLQHSFRQAQSLQAEAQRLLNQSRRDRALPMIERWQWIAAGAAFANPFPVLDLLATAAISTQMVRELGAIYQQQFSLEQAQAIARTLAGLMLKFGLVEFSTQTLSGLLKGNSLTYIAGGLIQAASAAYLTRMAGLSLVEHFQSYSPSPDRAEPLRTILPRLFKANQRPEMLQGLLQQATTIIPMPEQETALPIEK
ncbi:MAG: DUF697 domain-containing protein [Aphanocapsa sp. GSE-SYN-MK-11-07L]|nr:DUF697 domain-containing protein [Aphanocapsa sp. GSE-SYN-MK-11-07L]